jgi:hypothetical protein
VKFFFVGGLALLGLLGAGCITKINVRKVSDADRTKGIRYSLPATFLVGFPKSDGTIEFTNVFLPDPENTYAVDSWSLMAKYKLDLAISDGLLAKVDSAQHSDEIAKSLIESGGNLGGQLLTEGKKAQKEAADAAAKEKKDAADSAQKKVDDALAALDQARAAEHSAEDALTKAQNADRLNSKQETLLAIENAKVDLNRAIQKQQDAEHNLAAAQAGQQVVTARIAAGNIPKTEGAKFSSAWGPVVYRVVNADGGVKLVPAKFVVATDAPSKQIQMATSKKVSAVATNPLPKLTIEGSPTVVLPANGQSADLGLKAEALFEKLRSVKLMLSDGSGESQWKLVGTANGRSHITVSFPPEVQPGSYQLEIVVEYFESSDKLNPHQDAFPIRVSKAPK